LKYRILKYCLEYLRTGSHSTGQPVFWVPVTRSWSKFASNFRVPIIKSRGEHRPIIYAIAFRDANTTFLLKNNISLSVRAVSNSPFFRKIVLHLGPIKRIHHECLSGLFYLPCKLLEKVIVVFFFSEL
jgi:hypothetical protein